MDHRAANSKPLLPKSSEKLRKRGAKAQRQDAEGERQALEEVGIREELIRLRSVWKREIAEDFRQQTEEAVSIFGATSQHFWKTA